MKDKPKTATEWLKIPKDKRGVALAEVLTPMGTKHKFGKIFSSWKGRLKRCQHCGKTFPSHTKQNKCVPDPIVIDWNTAKHYEAVAMDKDPVQYAQCLRSLYLGGWPVSVWEIIATDHNSFKRLVAAAMAQDNK